jgi:phosphopantothenoylcysteine decarboxylase/phosphopantothenate--cysteine ligase
LGVCGGIAAYKAVELCRRLVDAGAFVSPVMTGGATRFVGPLTFSALASEPARTSLWDGPEPIPHTRLGQSADAIVVAPATARVIGAYAAGISSDLLTATLLATRAPVIICPAMHTEMWEHPAVTENLATLRRRGVHVVEPESGRLAGGDVGSGRLADPATIAAAVIELLSGHRAQHRSADPDLAGITALVTAGGTREPIDPVRFIGNRSSGKQGYAVAAELARRGAAVTLVSTATATMPSPLGTEVVSVETAAEMAAAVLARGAAADVVVMAAAVADFTPKAAAAQKLKKADGPPDVVLEPTTDILANLGANRRPGQVLVGFAAETALPNQAGDDLRRYAEQKLTSKGADLIVANDVSAPDTGFAYDTNAVLIVGPGGLQIDVPLASKETVAAAVVDAIARCLGRAPNPDLVIPPDQERT